jgi:DnaJ-class molecular chaperone
MDQKDYYEILQVEQDAAPLKIKEAYRRLAFQYHPDRNSGNYDALERMKIINEAYAVLSDTEKRARYDSFRNSYGNSAYDRFRDGYSEQDIFRGSDIGRIFEEISRSMGFRGFEDIFKEVYGPGYRTFQFGNNNVFGRGFVWFGSPGNKTLGQNKQRGIFPWFMRKLTGYVLHKIAGPQIQQDRYDEIVITSAQASTGGKISYLDKASSRNLLITVPAGISEGQMIRLQGLGNQAGAAAGDLYLKVQISKPLTQKIRQYLGF